MSRPVDPAAVDALAAEVLAGLVRVATPEPEPDEKPAKSIEGAWIRRLRRKVHISQAELAWLLDTARNTIVQYETGARRPIALRGRILRALEEALRRCPASEVYPRDHGLPKDRTITVEQRLTQIFRCAASAVPGGSKEVR